MNRSIFFYAVIAIIGVFVSAVSQVMLKKAALRNYNTSLGEYLNPLVIGAYILFVGATFMAIYAYKGIPLSLGPILEATSYIWITFFGVKIFGEKISKKKAMALGLIILGILVYAFAG